MRNLPKGVVLYQGPSEIDGAEIVVVATGFRGSQNPKTGNMVQTWILRADKSPVDAIHDGSDESICGACPLRGIVDEGRNRRRGCYVTVHQAPRQVWATWKKGGYNELPTGREGQELFRYRKVRMGAYGDPAAVPYRVWSHILKLAAGRSGYTHQWREGRFWRFKSLCMASVETHQAASQAQAAGWRTFRTSTEENDIEENEIVCPASAEAGYRLTCETCLACNGNSRRRGESAPVSIVIAAHGSPATISSYRLGVAQ